METLKEKVTRKEITSTGLTTQSKEYQGVTRKGKKRAKVRERKRY